MDWCLIGPVENGRNVVSVPCFQMGRCVAVEKEVRVEGNTEVYAIARTSGYSLGFTSDVPGLQRFNDQLTREWTARQYSPSDDLKDSNGVRAPWRTVKQWYVAPGRYLALLYSCGLEMNLWGGVSGHHTLHAPGC